jgi:phosphonate transport system substrate-binding protein
MHRFAHNLLVIFLLLFGAAPAGAAPEPLRHPMVLAVHPYLPSAEIQKRFAPLAEYLGKVLGQQVVVRVGRDYEDHITAIGSNAVDIAFMGPAAYVKTVARYGAKPLLARIESKGDAYLSGVIIARSDSPLRDLADLRGKVFAFGDPDSTMSSLVPRYALQQAGVPLTGLAHYEHLGAHENVALGVLAGDFDAGAVKVEVFDAFAARGLRVLANLPQVSEHVLVTRADLPTSQINLLRSALLNLKTAPQGSAIMQSIQKNMTGMVPVADADYDNLRAILRAVDTAQN